MRSSFVVVGVAAAAAAAVTGVLINGYLDSARTEQAAAAAVSQPIRVETLGVLVAAAPVDVGQPLGAALLEWQQWPASAANGVGSAGAAVSAYAGQAAAQKPFEGAIARVALLKGEILTGDKVVQPGVGSTLALVLPPGSRSLTIPVDPTSGAGGMIQPGDRVDIMLTSDLTYDFTDKANPVTGRRLPKVATETIMTNVRVMAADRRLATNPAPDTPPPGNVTLEVTREQAELLVTAARMGRFTLALRPLSGGDDQPRDGLLFATDQAIMVNVRAAEMGTTPAKAGATENPFFIPKPAAPPPPPSPPAPPPAPAPRGEAPAAAPGGVVIYNGTVPTFVPIVNGRAVPPVGGGQPGSLSLPPIPYPGVSGPETAPLPGAAATPPGQQQPGAVPAAPDSAEPKAQAVPPGDDEDAYAGPTRRRGAGPSGGTGR